MCIICTFMIDYIIYYKLTKFHKKSNCFLISLNDFLFDLARYKIYKKIYIFVTDCNQSVINCNLYCNQPKIIDLCSHEICIFFFFTFVTRWSCETGHVTVACITVPLLYARAMIRAHVVCTLFARMQIGVHITTGFY